MVTVQVSDHDWSLVLKYWRELEKHLNHPDDREKIHFVNQIIFESASLNKLEKKEGGLLKEVEGTSNISPISIEKMSQIMNEIDNELSKSKIEKKSEDLKDEEDDEMKIDSKVKRFVVEPV